VHPVTSSRVILWWLFIIFIGLIRYD